MDIHNLSGNRVALSLDNPVEAYWLSRAGMPGHPLKSVRLWGKALIADPEETAEQPLRAVLPVASLERSQQSLEAEADRLKMLRTTLTPENQPVDATPETIAVIEGLSAAIRGHLGTIAVDNA